MRSGNILFSAVHLFVILFILSLGAFFLAFSYAEAFRFQFSQMIYEKPEFFKFTGGMILGFGIFLFVGFYLLNRRRFLTIKMGPAVTLVDEAIVHDYVEQYWAEKYPAHDSFVDVFLQKGEILEIIVSIPENWKGEVEKNLLHLQNDLREQLTRRLGYYREFYLTLLD